MGVYFSPLDPELSHPIGGVGGMARDPFRIYNLPPRSPALAKHILGLRCGFFGCNVGMGPPLGIFVIYGWTGGHVNDYAN